MNALRALLPDGQSVAFWTREAVIERLREALRTLSLLPVDRPAGSRSCMPQVVQRPEDWFPQPGSPTFKQEWRYVLERIEEERHRFRAVPTAASIDRMEEALSWQSYVSPRDKWRALAGYAMGARGSQIAFKLHTSKRTALRWKDEAADMIVRELNR